MPDPAQHGSLFGDFSPVSPETWDAKVRSETGRSPEEVLTWSSVENVTIPAYLHPDALQDVAHLVPDVDSSPLAGPQPLPANDWAVCQPLAHPDPETANEHARAAVMSGAEQLQLRGASQRPSPHDHGVDIRASEDLATALDGIDATETSLHLGPGPAGAGLYILLREFLLNQDIDPERVGGSVLFDPVAALAAGDASEADSAFALANQLTADAAALPDLRSVSIDARVYHDAGASAPQELAATLAALAERLARSTEQPPPLPALLKNLQLLVSVSTSYFVEIAKLRALRLLVPQVVDAFADAAGMTIDFHPADLEIRVETSRRTETLYDPYVNMLRATTEALAAVLGGCDALTIRAFDDALRPPDAFGLRIARNVQLILRHEAHVDQVADPAAGSYYLETLTDQLAERAWRQFQEIEDDGGIVDTLRDGTLQQRIAETRRARRDAIDQRTHVLVGTTHYPNLDEQRREDLVPPAVPQAAGSPAAPSELSSFDALVEAAQNGATLPDLVAVLGPCPTDIEPLPRIRVAEEIESIRLRTEAYADAHDGPPQVLLAPLGPPAARSARTTFARNFLGVAGFAIEEPLKFENIEEVADTAVEHDADLVVLCSSDAEYADLAPSLTSALANRDQEALLGIAGAPDDLDTSDHADFYVHQGSSLKETLTMLQERLGIDVTSEP